MISKQQHIIIVPGLGDDLIKTKFFIDKWKQDDKKCEIWNANWSDLNESYKDKYNRLQAHINKLNKDNKKVSLVGISAGAGLVGNIFMDNPKLIHKMINICGRLRMKKTGLPTLEFITFRNKAYKDSISSFEKSANQLSKELRSRIITFSGLYDELVPTSTIALTGARNITIPFIGHNFCIMIALLFYKTRILDFLKS